MPGEETSIEALRRKLQRLGVPEYLDLDIRCAPIQTRRDGSFDIDEDGPLAVIVPIDPESPNDDNCVAFYSDAPRRWWVRSTGPAILNARCIDRAMHFKFPLAIWASPLSFLRARGDGIVFLNDECDFRFWLAGVGILDVETLRLAEAIERRLRSPVEMPRIRILSERRD